MKERPDLNTLSKEVFEANKAKGFHDVEVSNETLLMLVITELSEAVEADRKGKRGKRANLESFCLLNASSKKRTGNPDYFNKVAFEGHIKDTVEDELADAVIRLLDLAGLRDLYIDNDLMEFYDTKQTFCDEIFWIGRNLMENGWDTDYIEHSIYECLSSIECLCTDLQIDLWQHVSLKLKYNQTRPIKHGKNY